MSDFYAAGGLTPQPAGTRDQLADHRKAIEAKIALHRSIGEQPPSHLLTLLAELDARQGRTPAPEATEPEPSPEPFEHKAEEPLPENAVRRGPGRPRKPSDADRA